MSIKAMSSEAGVLDAIAATAAGQTAVNGAACDMQGFDSVCCLIRFGAITSGAATSINWAQSTTSGGTYTDLAGTGVTVNDDDDNQWFMIDLHKPAERFVRIEVARATQDSVIDGAVYLRYNAKELPVTQNSSVTVEHNLSPAEGTA